MHFMAWPPFLKADSGVMNLPRGGWAGWMKGERQQYFPFDSVEI